MTKFSVQTSALLASLDFEIRILFVFLSQRLFVCLFSLCGVKGARQPIVDV